MWKSVLDFKPGIQLPTLDAAVPASLHKQCFCAESLPDYVTFDHDGCTASCKKNTGETCGGTNALTVYQLEEENPPPTPAPTVEEDTPRTI